MGEYPVKRLAIRDKNGVVRTIKLDGGDSGGKRTCRAVVGTSSAGWTEKDCDYLCDGVDDQVEIQSAIQAINSAGGGEVILLNGIYNISSQIASYVTNVTISGSGATVLKKVDSGTGGFNYAMLWLGGAESTLENVIFDGADFRKAAEKALFLQSPNKFTIRGNTFKRCTVGCIQVEGGKDVIFDKNFLGTSNYSRISIYDCEQVVVTGNIARRDDDSSGYEELLYIQNCKKVIAKGNISKEGGIRLLACKRCVICENILKRITLEKNNDISCDFCIITGNNLESAVSTAYAGDGSVIDGNVVYTESLT